MLDISIILIIGGAALILAAAIFFLIRIGWGNKRRIDAVQNEAILSLERRISDLMNELKGTVDGKLTEIRGNFDKNSGQMYAQMSSFTKETVQIKEELQQVQEAMKGISTFQEFFKAPKLRGQWGEASLEHILSQYFPKDLYQRQYAFTSGEKVDAVLKLPDGKILPIDAKFNFDNFRKMVETSAPEEKEIYRKKFLEDSKSEVQRISAKYILPSEKTVDFALMYVPAEAVYYEINTAKDTDLVSFAWSKKIILTSPNTIYLTLKIILHWFQDSKMSKQTQQILDKLNKIKEDSARIMDDFRKLGSHLKNAFSSFDDAQDRLTKFDNKVEKLIDISEEKKLLDN